MNDIALLIPAYQPNYRLVNLIEEILNSEENCFSRVIIINDGSDTSHSSIFNTLIKNPAVTVLNHSFNLGKGAAIKTGFQFILDSGNEISIVTADADGQHAPNDILRIAKTALSNHDKLVLGVREFGNNVPLRSQLGNKLTCVLMRIITGIKLYDTQTGLRAWPKNLAKTSLEIPMNGYEFEMEALVRSSRITTKGSILQIPISTIYIDSNQSSHFDPLLDSMRIYFVFIRFCGAGLFTALIDNMVFITAYQVHHDLLFSQILSRLIGAIFSLAMSYHVVFYSKKNRIKAGVKFFSLVTVFGFISFYMITLLNTTLGINIIASKLLVELSLFIFSFIVQRNLIFNR